MIDVIYLSGGSGKRANLGYPKQFARIAGKPIIVFGLEILNQIEEVSSIIIPCVADYIEKTKKIVKDYNIKKPVIYVDAGKTRQESVYNALNGTYGEFALTEYILIMESVRPFITVEFVKHIIDKPGKFIVPRNQPVSTVICDWGKTIDRNKCGEVQMPQKYLTKLLIDCHEAAIKRNGNYTDDAQLVLSNCHICNYNILPHVITGLECNIKITTPLDLKIAEGIYTYSKNY